MDYESGDTYRCPNCGGTTITVFGATRWMGHQVGLDPQWGDEMTYVQVYRLWCDHCDEDWDESDGADLREWRI